MNEAGACRWSGAFFGVSYRCLAKVGRLPRQAFSPSVRGWRSDEGRVIRNRDRVLSPGFTVKRYCMTQKTAERQNEYEIRASRFPIPLQKFWDTARVLGNPVPPVEVRTGFDRVPSTLEILPGYNFAVGVACVRRYVESWNVFRESILPRHFSRLKMCSTRETWAPKIRTERLWKFH